MSAVPPDSVLPPDCSVQVCTECEALLDTSGHEPLEAIACPQCGAALTVDGQIAHYQVVEEAGRGGMGVVYKAYDPSLDRHIALKVLRKAHSADRRLIERLETEAAITASVTDPNVVRVYGSGMDRGRFYLAMELVEKGSLDSLMALQGRVAEEQVLRIGADVARGLSAACRAGLIHRDVKPGNILFTSSQTAKIVDFGLAVFQEQEESVRGEIWGTPYYVAPEKLAQEPEDFRSDIYSLGGTLFHALAGRPPFEAENATLVVLKHLKSQQVCIQSFAPWVSNCTAHIINRMLNKDREQRFQSYEELIESLEYALAQLHDQSGAAATRARIALETAEERSKWMWVSIAIAGLLVVGILGFVVFSVKGSGRGVTKPAAAMVRIGARYEALQKPIEALAAGQKEAADLFDEAAKNAALAPADRAWAQLFKGAALLAADKAPEAREAFEALGKLAPQVEDKKLRKLLERTAAWLSDDKQIPPAEAAKLDASGHEAAALLLYALHEWQGGRTEEAAALFRQFRSATPAGTAKWIDQLHPLAVTYIERRTAFQMAADRLKAATSPRARFAEAETMRRFERAFAAATETLIAPFKAEIDRSREHIPENNRLSDGAMTTAPDKYWSPWQSSVTFLTTGGSGPAPGSSCYQIGVATDAATLRNREQLPVGPGTVVSVSLWAKASADTGAKLAVVFYAINSAGKAIGFVSAFTVQPTTTGQTFTNTLTIPATIGSPPEVPRFISPLIQRAGESTGACTLTADDLVVTYP